MTSDANTLQQTSAAQSNLGPSEAPSRSRTPPSGVSIRPAELSDAARIAEIGARVFDDTFAHTCSQEDMDDYLSTNFTEAIITAELNDTSKSIYVASVDGRVAAFLVLTRGSTEACVEHVPAEKRIEIQRVYADPDVQGRGVAAKLMTEGLEIARKHGFSYAWLGVWENNVRATKFYEKFGFERLDYIFAREL